MLFRYFVLCPLTVQGWLNSVVFRFVCFLFFVGSQGWCRAELLTRLVGSGLHNFFFCESCDGSLQQVTREMVRGIHLNVFSGDFQCCSCITLGARGVTARSFGRRFLACMPGT